jgi:hypothetical protein
MKRGREKEENEQEKGEKTTERGNEVERVNAKEAN